MSDELNHDDLADDPNVRDIEALLRELDADDLEPVTPPASVWAGIDAQTAAPAAAPATVRSISGRRPSTWMLAAAAALVLIVVGSVLVLNRGDQTQVLSQAALTFDPAAFDPLGADATAQATLMKRDDTYMIRLSDASLPELADDDLELWLIQPDANGNPLDVAPVALVDPDGDGVYEVPEGLDPTTHYVVDISIEPRDGVHTHSGRSILRGALQSA